MASQPIRKSEPGTSATHWRTFDWPESCWVTRQLSTSARGFDGRSNGAGPAELGNEPGVMIAVFCFVLNCDRTHSLSSPGLSNCEEFPSRWLFVWNSRDSSARGLLGVRFLPLARPFQ